MPADDLEQGKRAKAFCNCARDLQAANYGKLTVRVSGHTEIQESMAALAKAKEDLEISWKAEGLRAALRVVICARQLLT